MSGTEIAVVGLAGRFPGAPDVETFWHNLENGVESIAFFSAEELAEAGVDEELLARPEYVRAHGFLEGAELFDAPYFGYSPLEAELIDPQHRIFLELAVEALERSGYAGGGHGQVIGVYAGASENTYLLANLRARPELLSAVGTTQVLTGTAKDFLATRVSYKLDLTGPAITVQTACSTSLVAVHLACQALLSGECDVALAGGVSVKVPQVGGYLFQDDGISSPDGHCRAFDAAALGTVGGSGAGVVVLRRLDEALAAGDTVHAVIKGSVVNNDGARKAGFTAPSVDGQAMAVRTAQLVAEVDPETVTLVEAHGTGTPLGDPIEVAALVEAFDIEPGREAFCALGSVKSNLGHLDAAAGVAGLIKTVLALEHALLPPSLHVTEPNPRLDLASSPFYVNTEPRPWPSGPTPRRAGVSAFGIGGTNAHVVLEEAPPPRDSGVSRPYQLILLSAATPSALDTLTGTLAEHLREPPELDAADVAYTLQVGRRPLRHRRALVCAGLRDAAKALAACDPERLLGSRVDDDEREVFVLFSGLGEQYVGMGRELYEAEPTFRQAVDRCCDLLEPRLGVDLRTVLYPAVARVPVAAASVGESDLRTLRRREIPDPDDDPLTRTEIAQPAVFVVGHALTELWREWGIRPAAAAGYSLGEYLAALEAGVFSLEDALFLVAERARLIAELPPGRMLGVPLGRDEILPLLGGELSLAAVNAPSLSVAAGPPEAVAELRERLAERGVAGRLLRTTHAFHSRMMEPAAARFAELLRGVELKAPRLPFLSNVTGTWIRSEDAVDPDYWARHMVATVRFSDNIGELLEQPGSVLLEVGPGSTLLTFARQHPDPGGERRTVGSLPAATVPAAEVPGSAAVHMLRGLGRLWLAGVRIDGFGLHRHERRRRVVLPTYPFERRRYWPEPAAVVPAVERSAAPARHDRPALDTPYTAPESALETSLAGMWQEVLGLARVGVHDDFFELGGHSLSAVRLLARIRDELGFEVPLSALFTAPTAARMARLLADETALEASESVVVPIQPSGERPPLFCVAPVLGTVFPYYELARHLGRDQPFYGLQPPVLRDGGLPLTRIEDQAGHFAEALRAVQPSGPYSVGGWSYGTLVAFELARQLRERGEEVALVALLDAPAPVRSQRPSPWQVAKVVFDVVVKNFWPWVRDYFYLLSVARKRPGGMKRGDKKTGSILRLLVEGAAMAGVVPPESRLIMLQPPQIRAMLRALRENSRAAMRYRPSPYEGRVTLFRTDFGDDGEDPRLGWDELAADVDVRRIPGGHMTFLRAPHVEVLARELRESLESHV